MTGLRDRLRRKNQLSRSHENADSVRTAVPALTIVRSDTHSREILNPPSFGPEKPDGAWEHASGDIARGSSHPKSTPSRSPPGESRLSSIFHLRSHSRTKSNSASVQEDQRPLGSDQLEDSEDKEAQWEKKATILAQDHAGLFHEPRLGLSTGSTEGLEKARDASPSRRSISDAQGDVLNPPLLCGSGALTLETG